jgi:hypothetical protein
VNSEDIKRLLKRKSPKRKKTIKERVLNIKRGKQGD